MTPEQVDVDVNLKASRVAAAPPRLPIRLDRFHNHRRFLRFEKPSITLPSANAKTERPDPN